MVSFVAFLALQSGALQSGSGQSGSAQSGSIDPSKDPGYAKPITVELAMVPLRTVVAAMTKAVGKPIDVSGVLSDWKATVLVKDLPAGRAMEALADTLGLIWKLDGDTIRLSRPEGEANAIAALEKDEVTLVRQPAGLSVAQPTTPAVVVTPGNMQHIRGTSGAVEGGRIYSRFNPFVLATEVSGGRPLSRLKPAAPLGTSDFAKAVAAWPSVPATIDPAWQKPVSTVLPKTTWEAGEVALSDLLVAWHAASGLPVIADAFRVPLKSTNVLPTGALEGLQGIATRDSFSLKLSDGVARMRHPAFWRLRTQEIPESTWGTIERNRADLGAMANFAAGLNAAQAASFHTEEAPLSHVSTAALREAYPALILWNTFSGDVRAALSAGRPVALAQTPGSKNAYAYALREAPYWDGGDPTEILRANPAKVGIFGQVVDKSIELRLTGSDGSGGVVYTIPF